MGAFLAFYPFVGFEDMVNIAEEVKQPQRNLPLAALTALAVATVLYGLVSWVAVHVVSPAELAASEAPLALVYQRSTGASPLPIAAISLCAVVNGALIQIIMGSRILYGMSRQGWLPLLLLLLLGQVYPRTATPALSVALVTATTLGFALALDLRGLAELTSFLVLGVFVMVNAALICVKGRGEPADGVRQYPVWVAWCGLLVSALFIIARLLI